MINKKNKTFFKHSNKGFTLIEVLVSAGILSFVAVVAASASVKLLSSDVIKKNFDSGQNVADIVSTVLNDTNYCTLHFNTVDIPDNVTPSNQQTLLSQFDIRPIDLDGKLSTTESLFKVGTELDNVVIDNMNLSLFKKLSPTKYVGDLMIRFKPKSKYALPFKQNIRLIMDRDPVSKKLVSCQRVLPSGSIASGAAGVGKYSDDCLDYQIAGWDSQDDCYQDGRWHTVLKGEYGKSTLGNGSDLFKFEGAAEHRVVYYRNGPQSLQEVCSKVLFNLTPPYAVNCYEDARSIISVNATKTWSAPTNPGDGGYYPFKWQIRY